MRSPKVYVGDSGLLHTLLGLGSPHDVVGHPEVGGSREGFVIGQVTQALGVEPQDCYHWATHAGAELDLLVVRGRRRLGFEVVRTEAPRVTKSIRSAVESLRLHRLDVVHASAETFPLTDRIRAVAAADVFEVLGDR